MSAHEALIVVALAVALAATYGLRRNDALTVYRLDMIEWVFAVRGEEHAHRRYEYDSASRDAMLYKFWRSFDSFCPRYAAERRASAQSATPQSPHRASVS